MPDISLIAMIGAAPMSGIVCSAYRSSRFGSLPVPYDTAPPGGAADAVATSGDAFGGPGRVSLTVPTFEEYWVAVPSGGHIGWVKSPSPVVPESDVTALIADLGKKAIEHGQDPATHGAICDGSSHPLSGFYGTLAAAQAVYPHAVALTDEIDWAAIQAAVNIGPAVTLWGLPQINRTLTVPNGVSVRGGGGLATIIKATSAMGSMMSVPESPNLGGFGNRYGVIQEISLDGNGLATKGMDIGICVSRTWLNVHVQNCTDVGWLLNGTQNCTFIGCDGETNGTAGQVQSGNFRLNHAASSNMFLRCESNSGVPHSVVFADNAGFDALPPNGLTSSTGSQGPMGNIFQACMIERPVSGSTSLIYARCGRNNRFLGCNLQSSGARLHFDLDFLDTGGSLALAENQIAFCQLEGDASVTALRTRNTFHTRWYGNFTEAAAKCFDMDDASTVVVDGQSQYSTVTALWSTTGTAAQDTILLGGDFQGAIQARTALTVGQGITSAHTGDILAAYVPGGYVGDVLRVYASGGLNMQVDSAGNIFSRGGAISSVGTSPGNLDFLTNGDIKLRIGNLSGVEAKSQLYPGAEAIGLQTAGGLLHSTGVPANANGNDNDWCISDNGHLYFKAGGVWVQQASADSLLAHLAGAETVTGVKTFTANPVFNAAAIPGVAVTLGAAIAAASAGINSTETQVVGLAIPANGMHAGTTYRITASGVCTSSVANASHFRARIGTTTLTGNIAVDVSPTAAASGTAIPFSVDILVTVRTSGASGSVIGSGNLANNGVTGVSAAAITVAQSTATVALDTTAAKILELTFQAAAATTTCTFHDAAITPIVN